MFKRTAKKKEQGIRKLIQNVVTKPNSEAPNMTNSPGSSFLKIKTTDRST